MRRFSITVLATRITFLLVFLLIVGLRQAQAQANFTFTPTSSQTGMPGQTLTYKIDLTTNSFFESLEGFNFTLDGDGLPLDSSPFESFLTDPNTPDPLPLNLSLTDLSAFNVAIGAEALPGTYSGTADIWSSDFFGVHDVSQNFTVVVVPGVVVPEIPSFFLLAVGLLIFCIRWRGREKQAKMSLALSLLHRFALVYALCGTIAPAYAQTGYHYLRTIAPVQLGQFANPRSVAVDPSGNRFVADTGNSRVQKFDSNGNFLLAFGGRSIYAEPFGEPTGVAVDTSGNVYVADLGNSFIAKFDNNGTLLSKFGSSGSGNGQFNFLNGIALDSAGDIYAADSGNYRVQKFDKNGNFLFAFGSKGSGHGQFGANTTITLDHQGNVYVADGANQRVQKFDKNGQFLLAFGSKGAGNGQFSGYDYGVAVDASGDIYVTDTGHYRVQKFNSSGSYLFSFGSQGSGEGQFLIPYGISIGNTGNVLVTDVASNRIEVFDKNGKFLGQFGQPDTLLAPQYLAFDHDGNLLVTDPNQHRVAKFDKLGSLLSTFVGPSTNFSSFTPLGITVDPFANIFVADITNEQIDKFDKNGTFLFAFGQIGHDSGEFANPAQIASDTAGNIYIVDSSNDHILKFSGQGVFLGQIGSEGFGNGQFILPEGIAIDSAGNLFVSDFTRVQKFNAQGQYVLTAYGQISMAQGLAVDQDDYVYVSDGFDSNQIQRLRNDGTFVLSFGQYGDADGMLGFSQGIALDTDGNLYVADVGNRRITVFAPDPAHLDLSRITPPTVTRDKGVGDLLVTVNVTNLGTKKATKAYITGARLNQTATKTHIPVALPDIATRDATSITLRFPATAAASQTRPFVFVDLIVGNTRTTASVRTATIP